MRLFVLTFALVLGSLQLGFSETMGKGTFEADGEHWTVTFTPIENLDSDFAHTSLQIRSDSNATAIVQPAWIGDDPGDLGPLWVIQNQEEEILGACWSLYETQDLECLSLYVPPSFSLD